MLFPEFQANFAPGWIVRVYEGLLTTRLPLSTPFTPLTLQFPSSAQSPPGGGLQGSSHVNVTDFESPASLVAVNFVLYSLEWVSWTDQVDCHTPSNGFPATRDSSYVLIPRSVSTSAVTLLTGLLSLTLTVIVCLSPTATLTGSITASYISGSIPLF